MCEQLAIVTSAECAVCSRESPCTADKSLSFQRLVSPPSDGQPPTDAGQLPCNVSRVARFPFSGGCSALVTYCTQPAESEVKGSLTTAIVSNCQ